MRRLTSLAAAMVAVVTAVAGEAHAGVMLVPDVSGIAADGTIDWTGTTGSTLSNPFPVNVSGISGLTATVSQSGSSVFTQSDYFSFGSFEVGEQLLWTSGNFGPMSFVFSSAIQGFGVQIQAAPQGGFRATLEAFDAADQSLGSVFVDGTNDRSHYKSFIGIRSDSTNIARVTVSAYDFSTSNYDFAINSPRIELSTTSAVPEPASLALLGIGGISMLGGWYKRRNTIAV